jgi:hypothetical protein
VGSKTQGVHDLVVLTLREISPPYGIDIIEDVFLAIERDAYLLQRYRQLAAELRAWVVNNWIGRYTKQETGLNTIRQVPAKRSELIKSYSQLRS